MKLNFELLTQKFNLFFYFWVINSKLKKKKFHFELLKIKPVFSYFRVTDSKIKLLFFYFRVTNSKLKNKKLHFELLTRSQKIKRFTSEC